MASGREVYSQLQDTIEETGVNVDIGLDCAASQFFKDGKYIYSIVCKRIIFFINVEVITQ